MIVDEQFPRIARDFRGAAGFGVAAAWPGMRNGGGARRPKSAFGDLGRGRGDG